MDGRNPFLSTLEEQKKKFVVTLNASVISVNGSNVPGPTQTVIWKIYSMRRPSQHLHFASYRCNDLSNNDFGFKKETKI